MVVCDAGEEGVTRRTWRARGGICDDAVDCPAPILRTKQAFYQYSPKPIDLNKMLPDPDRRKEQSAQDSVQEVQRCLAGHVRGPALQKRPKCQRDARVARSRQLVSCLKRKVSKNVGTIIQLPFCLSPSPHTSAPA